MIKRDRNIVHLKPQRNIMNIEVHGLVLTESDEPGVRLLVNVIWGNLFAHVSQERWTDCAVTIVRSQSSDYKGRWSPFIRIYSDKKSDFELAKKFLKPVRIPGAGIRTFVECVLLKSCAEL